MNDSSIKIHTVLVNLCIDTGAPPEFYHGLYFALSLLERKQQGEQVDLVTEWQRFNTARKVQGYLEQRLVAQRKAEGAL
jgi:hypothetical protein